MNKTSLATIVLALAAPIALVGCSDSSSTEMISLTLQSNFDDRQIMDTGEDGSTLGDYVNGNGDLLDESGQVIGQFDTTSHTTGVTETTETRMVIAEYQFGDGADSFLIQGAEQFQTDDGLPVLDRPLTYAVIGGTGKYFGANGECLVHRRQDAYTIECTFLAIKR
jgi:hypothetical protein